MKGETSTTFSSWMQPPGFWSEASMVVNPAQSRVGLTFNFKILPLQKGQVSAQKKYRQLSEDEDILLTKKSPPPLHPVRLDLHLFIMSFFGTC